MRLSLIRIGLLSLTIMFSAAHAQDAAGNSSPTPAQTSPKPGGSYVHQSMASPRDTMFRFLEAMGRVERKVGDVSVARTRAIECLDLSAQAASGDAAVPAQKLAAQLKTVIDKIGTVTPEELPDIEDIRRTGEKRFKFFFRPESHSRVYEELKEFGRALEGSIHLEEGADGKWRFAADTVAEIPALYQSMVPLRELHQGPDSTEHTATQIIELIGPTFAQTQWWEWGVLFVAIFVGLALGKLAQSLLRGGAKRLEDRGADIRATILADAASPVSLVLFTVGMSVGLAFIRMAPEIATFAGKTTVFLVIISAGWFLYNLIDLADVALKRITDRSDSKIDNMIVPLVRKTLRIFLVIVFTIVVLQNVFDMNITGFLASLGIAGLAISLAAQDSVKNLFGSITVFFDKPFVVGDRIVFDGYDGVVEEIGFRSTRIRTLVGHLITVPNMKFIDGSVENVAARPYLRRLIDVTITYDTPADKIELAVRILKDILNDPQISEPFDLENMPPRVSFNDFNATSLNIKVFYWYQLTDGRDYWGFLDHSEKVNMRLFKAYGEAGIEFAFPTQTVYLAGDPARELRLKLESGSGDDDGPRAYT